jgi:maltose O-acetyltransferase
MSEIQKTEKQKMLAGELYLASDPELAAEMLQAASAVRVYNTSEVGDRPTRTKILQALFGSIGSNPIVVPPFHCDYGNNIHAGDNLYMNYGCVILDCNRVHIGDNLLCGPYVQIYTASHPLDPTERLTGRELSAPITIGNNVWIGGGAIICPGVTIGDNTTIGAGSVVVKDIPANVLAVGNPCRVVRSLEPKEAVNSEPMS